METKDIVFPVLGTTPKREAILVALHAMTSHLPAALHNAKKYAIRDGLGNVLSDDDLRSAILYVRAIVAGEMCRGQR
jgi:hypothetical protein